MKTLAPPLKWHGGKTYMAKNIIGLMPPRVKNPNDPRPDDPGWVHYVEPYFGGGAVMLANDPEGISEVANDLNGDLTNFWSVIGCPALFPHFQRIAQTTPFSEIEYRAAVDRASRFDDVEQAKEFEKSAGVYGGVSVIRAACFFVRCRQSLSGRMAGFAGVTRNRTRQGMNEQAAAWMSVVDGLPEVHARMRRVLILNKPALDVIRKEDGERTLFYLDPPYLHETRATTGEYAHEMTDDDHAALLESLGKLKGRFLLSGYRSAMYDAAADSFGWRLHEFDKANNAAGGKTKKRMTECVWTNYAPEKPGLERLADYDAGRGPEGGK